MSVVSHNSVIQRNIVFACIMRPESWRFIGIDLKKVELSGYRKYSDVVLGIATVLEDALICLRFAQETMMKRYTEMEELQINDFKDLPNPGQSLLVMVDEAGELLSPVPGKSDEAKEAQSMVDEAQNIIGSIARLGRAAGVHLVIATQRPDAKLLPGELKANLPVRICAGSVDGTASGMILDSPEGTRVKSNPRGRAYVLNHQSGEHVQGFFAKAEWIDEYRASIGLNPDGTRISGALPSGETSVDADTENIDDNEDFEIIEEASDEDDSFAWEDMDEAVGDNSNNEQTNTMSPPTQQNDDAPQLTYGKNEKDKFHRPEDDWDDFMEEVVQENGSKG